ncbi:hypothetical protein AB0O34_05050 [Sphaerisporangium sp. NPDC088356]|uniref:hypothetical protein n=1 Tax=Sphaerisporangium sp. NPDC088356 TaxID=3154871 RepID=UPI00343355E2
MGEFVGINPQGAQNLLSAMGETVQRAAALKPYLSASIAEADDDWPAGPGTEVLDRCWQFLTAAMRDLNWRTQTIQRVETASQQHGVKGAEFVFPSAESAHASGVIAGDAVKAAWTAYQTDPSLVNWRGLQSALADRQGKTTDTEYAAGLLAQLGPSAFTGILRAESRKHQNSRSGYSPADLARAKNDLGPLAEAFAAADSTGKAPANLRARLLDHSPMDDLAALLALAPQSPAFVVAAGTKLAKSSGHRSPDPDWNTHWLVKALNKDLAATQQLLATGDNAALLLRPEVVKGTGAPGFENMLADTLDKALAPGAGDDNLRRDAWIATIKVFSNHSAWPSFVPSLREGKLTTASPVGQVLARHLHQYFPELADVWMDRKDATQGSGLAWKGLTADQVSSFLGGLLRDPAALPILEKNYRAFVGGLNLGKVNPFGDAPTEEEREAQRTNFLNSAKKAGGLASLFISGLHEADLSAEEARGLYAQVLMFPLDMAAGAVAGQMGGKLVVETAIGKAFDIAIKGPAQDLVEQLWDLAPPGEASNLSDQLLKVQMDALDQSLREHHVGTLSESDKEYLQFTFKGMLYDALHHALEERDG